MNCPKCEAKLKYHHEIGGVQCLRNQLAAANAKLATYKMTDPFKVYPSTVEDLIHLLGAYVIDVLLMAKLEQMENELEAWENLARPLLATVLDKRDAEIERLRKELHEERFLTYAEYLAEYGKAAGDEPPSDPEGFARWLAGKHIEMFREALTPAKPSEDHP